MKFLMYLCMVVMTLLGVLGVGVVITKVGWGLGLPLLIFLSIGFTFYWFCVEQFGDKFDMVTGEFKDG